MTSRYGPLVHHDPGEAPVGVWPPQWFATLVWLYQRRQDMPDIDALKASLDSLADHAHDVSERHDGGCSICWLETVIAELIQQTERQP